jgi:hypothetical protein
MITKEIAEKIESEKTDLVGQAKALTIKTEADNIKATQLLAVIKKARKTITATFDPMYKAAKATLKAIDDEWKRFDDPLEEAEENIRSMSSAFLIAEEKRRAELQAKADAKFIKAAEKAEKTGKPLTIAPTIVANAQTAEGATLSKRWYAEVTDLKALAAAVAAGRVPADYIQANSVVLNRVAVALKEHTAIPGVVAKYDVTTTIRGV